MPFYTGSQIGQKHPGQNRGCLHAASVTYGKVRSPRIPGIYWWGRRDSNPHGRNHMLLRHARLPFRHSLMSQWYSLRLWCMADMRVLKGRRPLRLRCETSRQAAIIMTRRILPAGTFSPIV